MCVHVFNAYASPAVNTEGEREGRREGEKEEDKFCLFISQTSDADSTDVEVSTARRRRIVMSISLQLLGRIHFQPSIPSKKNLKQTKQVSLPLLYSCA